MKGRAYGKALFDGKGGFGEVQHWRANPPEPQVPGKRTALLQIRSQNTLSR